MPDTGPVNGMLQNGSTTTFRDQRVPTGITPSDIELKLALTHPNLSALSIALVSPDGTIVVPLLAQGAAAGANFGNANSDTVFSPLSTVTFANGAAQHLRPDTFSTPWDWRAWRTRSCSPGDLETSDHRQRSLTTPARSRFTPERRGS